VSGRLTEFRQWRAEPSQKQNWIKGVLSSVPRAHRPAVVDAARHTASTGGCVGRRTIDHDDGGERHNRTRPSAAGGGASSSHGAPPGVNANLRAGERSSAGVGCVSQSSGRLATPVADK